MINKSQLEKSEAYYSALGHIKWTADYRDIYRMKRVAKHLAGKSVFDAGCGKADFLNLIKDRYQISGIEVNTERVNYCNQVLRQEVVRVGNLDKKLDFADSSFDTVTCLEVLEHLVDPEKVLCELVRVSRKRVIITVPFNETIRYVLCMHCGKRTPSSDHLQTFNRENIRSIIPPEAKIVKTELIGNKALGLVPYFNKVIFRAPYCIISMLDKALNRIFPRASWMMVVLDKNNGADKRH